MNNHTSFSKSLPTKNTFIQQSSVRSTRGPQVFPLDYTLVFSSNQLLFRSTSVGGSRSQREMVNSVSTSVLVTQTDPQCNSYLMWVHKVHAGRWIDKIKEIKCRRDVFSLCCSNPLRSLQVRTGRKIPLPHSHSINHIGTHLRGCTSQDVTVINLILKNN